MSGKTSFIRTVAINLLTAKTLNTCFAKDFRIDINRHLYSVIHTEDNLLEGKSYFFKEVENVKAALDKGKREIIYWFSMNCSKGRIQWRE